MSTLIIAATAALGCDCQRTGDGSVDPASEMRSNLATERALFVGTVRTIEVVTNPPRVTEGQSFSEDRRITFDVEESWKGVTTPQFSVITGTGAGDCGYVFEVGSRYLIVTTSAHLYSDELPQVAICSNTMPFADAAPYIRALRQQKRSRKFGHSSG